MEKSFLLFRQKLFAIFFYFLSTTLNGQSINCHPCQNIANTVYTYSLNSNFSEPIWAAFRKKINCYPSTSYFFTNLQVSTYTIYNQTFTDPNDGTFTAYPPFETAWGVMENNPSVSKAQLEQLATKFRKAIEFRLNNNVPPPISVSATYRYVKCIEITNMTYVGFCCNNLTGLWKFDVKIRHGKLTMIPPND